MWYHIARSSNGREHEEFVWENLGNRFKMINYWLEFQFNKKTLYLNNLVCSCILCGYFCPDPLRSKRFPRSQVSTTNERTPPLSQQTRTNRVNEVN